MKKIIIITIVLISLGMTGAYAQANKDTYFEKYVQKFINAYWAMNPELATTNGYHGYDHTLFIPSSNGRKNMEKFQELHLRDLAAIRNNLLKPENVIDFNIMQNELNYIFYQVRLEKSWEWNPSKYNLFALFSYMLNENYAPLDVRLSYLVERMEQTPEYYHYAIQSIRNPVVSLTQLAINQHSGAFEFFNYELIDSIRKSNYSKADKDTMISLARNCNKAIQNYIAHLRNIDTTHARSFRLGKELYERAFQHQTLSRYTAAEIYQKAIDRKKEIHKEMAKISSSLWDKYFGAEPKPSDSLLMIRRVLDKIALNHTTPELFQETIELQIPELNKFVIEKDLLYIDPSKPLVVRREPSYMSGVAGASISAPGPYEKGRNTYYNVGSLEGWPADKAESYLREYNDYTLQILNIHEAIPGHYTQLVYANNSPSLVKTIFGNGAMIEGWAVYAELLMLENGYGNEAPEMWLSWYKWHLRTVCNTILDYSVHAMDMDSAAAMRLLTYEAFQQQAEAEGKWKRVTVSSVQLTTYFTGFVEIYELREAYKKKMGSAYKVKEFNEKFLSYGSAPVKYIRKLMLGDD